MRLLGLLTILSGLIGTWGFDNAVRGLSLSGIETQLYDTDFRWKHPSKYYLEKLSQMGFNYLRMPFSAEYVRLSDFSALDRVFKEAKQYNMKILLDYHRTYSGHQGDFSETTLNQFLKVWETIINRYKDDDTLQAIGLYNEYQGTDCVYWNDIMRQSVVHLETLYPNRFYFLVGGIRWSGDVSCMDLEDLSFSARIRYESHKYIFSGSSNPEDWNKSFGRFKDKVIVGEWGMMNQPDQLEWANRFVDWLIENNVRNTFFWMGVASSYDTGGIFKQDGETIEQEKLTILHRLWGSRRKLHSSNWTDYTYWDDISKKYDQGPYFRGNCP